MSNNDNIGNEPVWEVHIPPPTKEDFAKGNSENYDPEANRRAMRLFDRPLPALPKRASVPAGIKIIKPNANAPKPAPFTVVRRVARQSKRHRGRTARMQRTRRRSRY